LDQALQRLVQRDQRQEQEEEQRAGQTVHQEPELSASVDLDL